MNSSSKPLILSIDEEKDTPRFVRLPLSSGDYNVITTDDSDKTL